MPVPYFHIVFTMPAPIADIAFHNKAVVYAILFKAASTTLRTIGADPRHLGADIGLIAVLHTWGQTLHHHPHVHCVVPGGGLSPDGARWIAPRRSRFFLPVKVLSRLYRRLFLEELAAAFKAGELAFPGATGALADPARFDQALSDWRKLNWVVFAKPPFGGPAQVLAYLGRYTHRVAISNSRILSIGDTVSFTWKDYRANGQTKVMTLGGQEFIRRFLQHTLPDGFHRIRHYGFLANGHRVRKIAHLRQLFAEAAPPSVSPQVTPPTLDLDPSTAAPSSATAPAAARACSCCGGMMRITSVQAPAQSKSASTRAGYLMNRNNPLDRSGMRHRQLSKNAGDRPHLRQHTASPDARPGSSRSDPRSRQLAPKQRPACPSRAPSSDRS